MSCRRKDGARKENLSEQVVFLFFFRCFVKEIENIFSVFLARYRNTHESLGELKKAVEHLPVACVPREFLVLPNFHSCLYKSTETQCIFYISQKEHTISHNVQNRPTKSVSLSIIKQQDVILTGIKGTIGQSGQTISRRRILLSFTFI